MSNKSRLKILTRRRTWCSRLWRSQARQGSGLGAQAGPMVGSRIWSSLEEEPLGSGGHGGVLVPVRHMKPLQRPLNAQLVLRHSPLCPTLLQFVLRWLQKTRKIHLQIQQARSHLRRKQKYIYEQLIFKL